MQRTSLSDQELIENYLTGDEKSFEYLLNRHKSKIYTSIYLFVKDEDQANDIFQEVFIKIIDTLRKGKYNHEGKFLQWAMRIAYNMCVDQFRRGKRYSKVASTESFDIFDVLEAPEESMEGMMMRTQTHDRIRSLVDLLPEEHGLAYLLNRRDDSSGIMGTILVPDQ